jgi:hypothetical protein
LRFHDQFKHLIYLLFFTNNLHDTNKVITFEKI